ncbi:TonB-dependent receptor [Tolypothrix campylonemoides VB511288]|nr:TonB-dependent receptor [Tolypothrix campylonemoides VB511288]
MRVRVRRLSALIALSLAAPLTAFAQGPVASPDPAPAPTQLDGVQVVGRAQRLYLDEASTVGTRTGTPLEKVPQSVQVIGRELIDDQAARQITDLYRSISGISFFSYAGVTLRGFRQENVLYDGLRGDPYSGFAVPQLFNVERVEVLKGPAGALYGAGDPGGVVNYVSKRPTRTAQRRLELQAGDDDFAAASFEASGPVGERVRYRVGAYGDHENPFRFNSGSESRLFDAGLAFDLGDTGELLLQAQDVEVDLDANRLRGVPVNDDGTFLTTRRWNHNEPTDFLRLDAQVVQAKLTLAPTDALDLDASVRRFDNRERQNYHEPRGLIDRDRDGIAEWMTREFRDQVRDNAGTSANANAIWRVGDGAVRHTLLLGAERFALDSEFGGRTARPDTNRGPVPGIDLFDPVYGLTSGAAYGLSAVPYAITRTRSVREGVYLQDEIAIGERWQLLAGLRWDRFDDEDRVANTSVDGEDASWRLGATYEVAPGVNAYASVARGFLPQAAGSQSANVGGPFDAERSRQWEVGAKTVLAGGRISLNGAAYRIERTNILQATGVDAGGDGVDDVAPLGLVRSDGFEIDLLADLTPRWVLNVAYGYNDARVLDAGTNGVTNAVGDRFANAPRHKLGVWTRYELPAPAAGVDSSIAFGADHVGDRVSLDGQAVKAYTVFDASWQARWKQWGVQVNVKNLFDKVYAASGFNERGGHFPGEPRRVYVQASYSF